jgi:hypothetical protein
MGKLNEQFEYLKKIRKMKELALRRFHDTTFIGTRYSVKVPRWMHRSIVERRLFYYYCLRNYHHPKLSIVYQEFKVIARRILSKEYLDNKTPEQITKEELRNTDNFTATNIRAMPIVEVERYLTGLALFVDGSEKQKRKVLYEWFNARSKDLPLHHNTDGRKVARRRTGKLNNKYKLRDLILSHPMLNFDDFRMQFGNEMPTTSRSSFNNTRTLLRKAGYDIPPLKMGPSNPVVVSGMNGITKRGRYLNDTAEIGNENGKEDRTEEEPF